jgi:hypothetical protein
VSADNTTIKDGLYDVAVWAGFDGQTHKDALLKT